MSSGWLTIDLKIPHQENPDTIYHDGEVLNYENKSSILFLRMISDFLTVVERTS